MVSRDSLPQGLLDDVELEQIRPFTDGFMDELALEHSDVLSEIQKSGDLSGVAVETIRAALADYKRRVTLP